VSQDAIYFNPITNMTSKNLLDNSNLFNDITLQDNSIIKENYVQQNLNKQRIKKRQGVFQQSTVTGVTPTSGNALDAIQIICDTFWHFSKHTHFEDILYYTIIVLDFRL